MRFLKIMGIFTSILSLLSCGHGNKRVTQNDGINSNIPVATASDLWRFPVLQAASSSLQAAPQGLPFLPDLYPGHLS